MKDQRRVNKYGSQTASTGLRGKAARSSYVPVAVASPVIVVAALVKKTVKKEKKAKVVKPETIVCCFVKALE